VTEIAERYPMVRGVRIDVQALRVLAHVCDPLNCRHRKSCCETYEVLVDNDEISTIVGTMPDAAEYAKTLREDDEFIDPFDETDNQQTCLNTDEDGLCVFAYRDRAGSTWCSLHSAALELGLPPAKVKPKACALWPLFLHETEPPLLTVQNDATTFACNSLRQDRADSLHPGVADIIRAVFDQEFLEEVEALLQ